MRGVIVPNDASRIGKQAALQSFCLNLLKFPANTEVSNGVLMTFGK